MSHTIDFDGLPEGDFSRPVSLATDVVTAFERATHGAVTYVYVRGVLVAAIAPPEAGERYEHASEVEVFPRVRQAPLSGLALTSAPAEAALPLYRRVLRGLLS